MRKSMWPWTVISDAGCFFFLADTTSLSGTLPPCLGNLTALTRLYLQHVEQLSGTIPPSLGNLTALTALRLYSTQLEGTIPDSLGRLTALTDLYLCKSSEHFKRLESAQNRFYHDLISAAVWFSQMIRRVCPGPCHRASATSPL